MADLAEHPKVVSVEGKRVVVAQTQAVDHRVSMRNPQLLPNPATFRMMLA